MKISIATIMSAAAGVLLLAGCETGYDSGPYLPQPSATPPWENSERLVLLDPETQASINCTGISERMLDDNRLEITAQLRNRENHRIEVQANCVFKDLNGFSTGDETPFQTVILTENATETIKFTSANNAAKRYTIRVRAAR
jgi:hypothetical protein